MSAPPRRDDTTAGRAEPPRADTDEPDDPAEPAPDGMAPLINNTGADPSTDDDADASSG